MIKDLNGCSKTQLETIMTHARRKGGPEAQAFRVKAAHAYLNLYRQEHEDSVAGACHGVTGLMDLCRYEERGTRLKSNRSRQAIRNHGEIGFMTLVARGASSGLGFNLLVAGGLGAFTIEAIVVAHADRFPADAVEAARDRLVADTVPLMPTAHDAAASGC